MDTFTSENLQWFVLFVVPGFISIKVYDLMLPGERRDLSKALVDAITYSCINLAILYVPIVAIHRNDFPTEHRIWYYLASVAILLVAPIVWPILFTKAIRATFVRNRIILPFSKPWDYVFSKRQPYWIIVHMKDGRRVAGRYVENSYASSYPAEEQLYLEEVWRLDTNGAFTNPVERSRGIIIAARDVDMVEFFQ